ncbi:exported hypothetical protein [Pseudomonas sp. IT-P258]
MQPPLCCLMACRSWAPHTRRTAVAVAVAAETAAVAAVEMAAVTAVVMVAETAQVTAAAWVADTPVPATPAVTAAATGWTATMLANPCATMA